MIKNSVWNRCRMLVAVTFILVATLFPSSFTLTPWIAAQTEGLPIISLQPLPIVIQGVPNENYIIQATTNFLEWQNIFLGRSDSSGIIRYQEPDANRFTQRYFRAVLFTNTVNTVVFRSDRILVKPLPGLDLSALHRLTGVAVLRTFPAIGNLQVLELPAGGIVADILKIYQQSGLVQFAEADYLVRTLATPDDFRYTDGSLWALNNTGQLDGKPDADIDAPEGWDIQNTADNIVVAVIDTGVRTTHEDLAANLWRNPGEIPGNGLDDDGDGFVDDIFGINTIANNGDPEDDFGHGSHISGTIGGVGNNSVGVTGVAWRVQLMECKFIDSQGEGAISDAITCLDYARAKGANIVNASWGMPEFNSQALYEAIKSLRDAGVIFVAACGNSAANNDESGQAVYPASFDLDNIIAVAATTRTDDLAFFSNYGASSVDLGAPGYNIFSCWNGSDSDYRYAEGTSMAAAHVSGVCALLKAKYPGDTYQETINRVLSGTDPLPSLLGKCASGGRLNLQKALGSAPPVLPTVTVSASDANAAEAGPDNGRFTVTRTGSTTAALTVNYSLGGTAGNGSDYQSVPTTVTIPSGANSADVTVTPLDDSEVEGDETVVLTLAANAAYTVGSPDSATVTITDNDVPPVLPTVTVSASDANAAEAGPDNGRFTVTRTGSTTAALVVNYSLGGTAGNGSDYQSVPTTVTIPSGANSADVTVTPLDDSEVEGDETVVLTLAANTAYTVGSPDSATVTITDNDTPPPVRPTVVMIATDVLASEAGLDPGEFTLQRSGDTTAPLVVRISTGGTAINGVDYVAVPLSITIPAGESAIAVKIQPLDDQHIEVAEIAMVSLVADDAYAVGLLNTAIITILDDDL